MVSSRADGSGSGDRSPALRRSWSSSAGLIAARVQNRLEAPCRQLLNLLRREIDAAALGDPLPDIAHDLFDIAAISAPISPRFFARRRDPPLGPPAVGPASPAVRVGASARLWIVVHCHYVSTF